MAQHGIGQAQIAFTVFKINWVYFVRHGRRADFAYFYFLFEKAGLATTKNGLKWELNPIYKYDKDKIEETKKSLQDQAIANVQKFNEEILKNLPTFTSYQKLIPVFNRGDADKQSFILLADSGMYIGQSLSAPFVEVKNIPVQDSKLNINDVVVDPLLGLDKIYIAVGNKLLESVNRGNTWKVRSTGIDGLNNINQILIDKTNPEVIYLGLGEGQKKSGVGFFGF